MKVKDLLSALAEYQFHRPSAADQQEVTGLTDDSRKMVSGAVYVAVRGSQSDGHRFLPEVIEKNPAAVVVEDSSLIKNYSGLVLKVASSRLALESLASRYFSDPSESLFCFGVTGTNGKTSSVYMLEAVLNSVGITTGVIGTINHHLKDRVWPATLTTPGPLDLQSRLAEMKAAGAKAIAMEVSSHALQQHRADSVQFNTVIFTNLTLDHMDYHKDMENYFQCKQRLFTDLLWKTKKNPHFAIINTDDSWGARLRVAGGSGLWTYGKNNKADFRFSISEQQFNRTQFKLVSPLGEFSCSIPMCGEHNVYNAVGSVAAAASMGIPVPYALAALEKFAGVPGRLHAVSSEKEFTVLVDYAHSPDALENVLKTLQLIRDQSFPQAKIITVFGCGGDRDRSKRPKMAAVAESYADHVFVTSDNPRTEDPYQIIQEINSGFNKIRPTVVVDRRQAIRQAIELARAGDVVLIAGKGHEDYQQIGDAKIPFSDWHVAEEYLK